MLIFPIRKHQMLRCYGVTVLRCYGVKTSVCNEFCLHSKQNQTASYERPRKLKVSWQETGSFMAGNWEFQGRKV